MASILMENCNENHISNFLSSLSGRYAEFDAIYFFSNRIKQSRVSLRQVVADNFEKIIRKDEGAIFLLNNNNSIVIYNKKSANEIKAALIKIKYMFNDDLVVYDEQNGLSGSFVSFFNLAQGMAELKSLIRTNLEISFKENSATSRVLSNVGMEKYIDFSKNKLKEITPPLLGKMQKVLANTDFSNLIRRQSVCIMIGDSLPKILFDEVYISIKDLTDTLVPGVDLTSNTWLFQNLTESLDRRMLYMIRKHDDVYLISNFSININVSTILSDDFLMFDEHFSPTAKSTITFEFNILDILSDVKTFILAQTFLQYQGYKTCIDGITLDKLKYVNYKEMDCDLMKFVWHPDFMEVIRKDKYFNEHVDEVERSKIIISRIDDPAAIEGGKSLGINLFQGRYIQKILSGRR
ncbi:MAG: hypothetical protein PHE89_03570 [Alphaproteobacteria bacterium]|nr:hypothetical protein [Alphaproteobacteria bacterium]